MAATVALKAKLTLNDNAFAAGLRKAKGAAFNFAAQVGAKLKSVLTSPLAAVGGLLAGAFTAGAFVEGVKGAIDLGGHLNDLSSQTGETVDNLLIFGEVLKANGIESDALGGILNKLQKNIAGAANGSAMAAGNLQQIGLKASDLLSLKPVEQFKAIGEAIAKIQDPAKKAAAAISIFGKSGGRLMATFNDKEGYEQVAKSVGRQAKILKDNIEAFDTVGDRLGRAGLKFQGFFVGVTSKLLPVLLRFTGLLDGLDLASFGETVGKGLAEAANYIVGIFTAPEQFMGAFRLYMKGIGVEFGEAIAEGAKTNSNVVIRKLANFEDKGGLGAYLPGILGMAYRKEQGEERKSKASSYFDQANALIAKMRDAGKEWIGVGQTAKAAAKGFISTSSLTRQYTGGIKGASMALGGKFYDIFSEGRTHGANADFALNRTAYGQTPLLRHRETQKLIDAQVANGTARAASGFAAFGAIRSGDSKRKREVAKENERRDMTVQRSNELLGWIGGMLNDGFGSFTES